MLPEVEQHATICHRCAARSGSVCDALGKADLRHLAAAAEPTAIAPGAMLILEGDPADSYFTLTSGTVKLYKLLPDGRRQITGFAGKSDFVGLAASSGYAYSAQAIDRVGYCRFTRRGFRVLLDDHPVMEQRLLALASNELVAAQEQMLLLGRKTACERVASFLLAQQRRTGDGDRLSLPMTRGDIADYLGLTVETVSRSFTRLRTDGLIALVAGGLVRILDRLGLETAANGGAPVF